MHSRELILWTGIIGLFLSLSAESHAIPVVHELDPISTATVFVNTGGTSLLVGESFTAALTGTVVIDFATETVESFSISLAPDTAIIFCGVCSYGGQTAATINTATISSSSPFSGSSDSLIAPGLFTYTGTNAAVDAQYTVGGGSPISLSVPGSPILFHVNSLSQIVVTSQQLGILDGTLLGEPEPLLISSSFTMVLLAVPELGSGTLMLLGLAGLGFGRRRRVR